MQGTRTGVWLAAIAAALALLPAQAGEMCGGPCSFSAQFADGGSVGSPVGATITFGSGGSLVLGEGGSITLGEGGSVTPAPAEGAAPDMSAGGAVVLGPGGAISFGPGGSLVTGEAGGVSLPAESALDVTSAGAITLDSQSAVELGDIYSDGDVAVTSEGDVTIGAADSLPVNLTMPTGDSGASIAVTAGTFKMGALRGSGSFMITTNDGDVTVNEGAFEGGGEGGGESGGSSGGGSSSGSITLTTCNDGSACTYTTTTSESYNPGTYSGMDMAVIELSPAELPRGGGGAFSLSGSLLLLWLGLSGLGRRRR